MGGAQAANTLVDIKIKQLERSGKVLSDEEKKELFESVRSTYENQTDPRYGAARLWIDEIIFPSQTRKILINTLEISTMNPDLAEFNPGVIQT